MTYFELVKEIEKKLDNENADFEAKQIVLSALKTDNTGFITLRQKPADESIIKKCFCLAEKRNSGLPIYYVLGVCEFYSYEFFAFWVRCCIVILITATLLGQDSWILSKNFFTLSIFITRI